MVKKLFIVIPMLSLFALSGIYLYKHPEMYVDRSYCRTSADPVVITVPISGTKYVDIALDGSNTTLLETNKSTYWRFNDATILRTNTNIPDKINMAYQLGYAVYNKYGDSYISVHSANKLLEVTEESFKDNGVYDVSSDIPDNIRKVNEEIIGYSPDIPDVTIHSGLSYLNKRHRYGKESDILNEAVARLHVYGDGKDWQMYSSDDMIELSRGDEFIAIKSLDYLNSVYVFGNREGLELDTKSGDSKIKQPKIHSNSIKEFLTWCYYTIRR